MGVRNQKKIVICLTPVNEAAPREVPNATIGDAREYLIAYADLKFMEHAQNLGVTKEEIGWDKDELMNQVKEMPQNDFDIMGSQDHHRSGIDQLLAERANVNGQDTPLNTAARNIMI